MIKVKDLLKAILVEEGIKDQDAYLEGRILDCIVDVSDEWITVTHGSPVMSGMESLDKEVLYGAWVYSLNEGELWHTFEYRKDVQAAYILYRDLKDKTDCSDIKVMFVSSISDEIYEVIIKVKEWNLKFYKEAHDFFTHVGLQKSSGMNYR